jgi:transcriptional regulator with XRE-family HTH domain
LGTTEGDSAESLGDRIARLRRVKGWNQKELADRVGAKPTQISKYKRGVYLPRPEVLPKLGEALGVSLDYLMTGRSDGEPRRDFRLRERIEALEALPETQRSNLVAFLDALLAAHQLLRRYQELLQQHGRGALHPESHPPGKTPAKGHARKGE